MDGDASGSFAWPDRMKSHPFSNMNGSLEKTLMNRCRQVDLTEYTILEIARKVMIKLFTDRMSLESNVRKSHA